MIHHPLDINYISRNILCQKRYGISPNYVRLSCSIHLHTMLKLNGQAKLSNKTLIKLIKKKIEDNPRRWHEVLSEALWSHRISRNGATKVTPFELVYGQEVVLPIEVNFDYIDWQSKMIYLLLCIII